MGLFRRRRTEDRATTHVPWQVGDVVYRGQRAVTADVALQHAAVWSCVRLLSDIVSTMPVHAFRDSRVPLDPPPALLAAPAAYTTLGDWLSQVMVSTLTAGNT